MNQLTTIAALPSGAGSRSALPAERTEVKPAPPAEPLEVVPPVDPAPMPKEELARKYLAACLGEAAADRHGLEPFDYSERN